MVLSNTSVQFHFVENRLRRRPHTILTELPCNSLSTASDKASSPSINNTGSEYVFIASPRKGRRRSVRPLMPVQVCAICQSWKPSVSGLSCRRTLTSRKLGNGFVASSRFSAPFSWSVVVGTSTPQRASSLRQERRMSYVAPSDGLPMYCFISTL